MGKVGSRINLTFFNILAGAADVNLGEVHSGIKLNTEGRPYITYTLGSMCKDNNSSLGHMQTTIYFSCEPDRS